ncbi:39375_t:CDS:2 [Gigaspora margarita]|uniref:39375_t:CDS:1 n=1 Tax=Gigaspora margarita TaxID=4874 RepID=A0ABN7UPF1_GIGMA|nr:39375_t:CDS:2 [Gigaspora margarita]
MAHEQKTFYMKNKYDPKNSEKQKEKADKSEDFKIQRSKFLLLRLKCEYDRFKKLRTFRIVNLITNLIISISSIILGFIYTSIDHNQQLVSSFNFQGFSLSFGGIGVVTTTLATLFKFKIGKKQNGDEKNNEIFEALKDMIEKKDPNSDKATSNFIIDKLVIDKAYLQWIADEETTDFRYLVYLHRRLLGLNYYMKRETILHSFINSSDQHNLRHALFWMGEVYLLTQLITFWFDIVEIVFLRHAGAYQENDKSWTIRFTEMRHYQPIILSLQEESLVKKILNGTYIQTYFPETLLARYHDRNVHNITVNGSEKPEVIESGHSNESDSEEIKSESNVTKCDKFDIDKFENRYFITSYPLIFKIIGYDYTETKNYRLHKSDKAIFFAV